MGFTLRYGHKFFINQGDVALKGFYLRPEFIYSQYNYTCTSTGLHSCKASGAREKAAMGALLGTFGYQYLYKRFLAESSDAPFEQKLKEGRKTFEDTASYKILLEIRSLNESELQARTDVDVKEIEDTVLASFDEAYHILAEMESKLNHQDLLLCLYGYLKVPNNVIAFCMKSVPGTIRQRKSRLQGKLPEDVRVMLFS